MNDTEKFIAHLERQSEEVKSWEPWKQTLLGGKMKINCEVKAYEENGKAIEGLNKPDQFIHLESHWNIGEFVIVKIGDRSLTVNVKELAAAAERCHRSYGE